MTTKNDFFPEENYEIPETSNYMKFSEGDNKFRVLSSAITGWVYWNTNNKPSRHKDNWDTVPDDIKTEKDGSQKINHFWAFIVWNYKAKKVQILEITQKGIMKYIKGLVKNSKWGNPKGYDIIINKTGSGFDTEYTYFSDPHSDVDPKILEQFGRMKIDLELLYQGGDPFKPEK